MKKKKKNPYSLRAVSVSLVRAWLPQATERCAGVYPQVLAPGPQAIATRSQVLALASITHQRH